MTNEEIREYLLSRIEHYRLGREHAYGDQAYNFMQNKLDTVKEIYEEIFQEKSPRTE